MRRLSTKLKPANGVSYYLHGLFRAALPLLVLVFVRIDFLWPAAALVILSKWRMLVVRPRFWLATMRSNAVDIIFGLSMVVFMASTSSGNLQLAWMGIYILWLVVLKPQSGSFFVSLQALLGQTAGLMALFIFWSDAPLFGYVLAVWLIAYNSARHFFTGYDEHYGQLFSHFWGYFGAALMWVLGHWLVFYGDLSQPTLLLSVIGIGLGSVYYLSYVDRLSSLVRRNFVFIMIAIVTVVLAFSDWGDSGL